MEPIEAVIRSSAQRLRPVFLTTITAIGGLLPMMFAIEIDFWTRHVTIGGPNGMMWVQISTAIVFGLAFSKMITLGLVPAMLALPYHAFARAQSQLPRGSWRGLRRHRQGIRSLWRCCSGWPDAMHASRMRSPQSDQSAATGSGAGHAGRNRRDRSPLP